MMKQIITYHGDVETTSFFMTQIENQLRKDGFNVHPFYFNSSKKCAEGDYSSLRDETDCKGEMKKFIFLTFNFAGLFGDDIWLDENETAYVDRYNMKCLNIIVDHPYHYHIFMEDQIAKRQDRYLQFCIDKRHISYMKQYFPQIVLGRFLPSGGTGVDKDNEKYTELKPWRERKTDVIFTGTYIKPESFDVFIDRNGEEYSRFYHSMIDAVLADSQTDLETIVRKRLIEEIPEVTEPEITETLGHIQFLDYYVRFKRREDVIRTLVDAGIVVNVIGSGWETLSCKHPENLRITPYLTSQQCLDKIADAKISLNILPCFHGGAHDRIFNTMLCGAVCITDSNEYLNDLFTDGENVLIYNIDKLDALPQIINDLLNGQNNQERGPNIAKNGFAFALNNHTWANRAEILEDFL